MKFEKKDECLFCDICERRFKEEDEIKVLTGPWGVLLVCHGTEDIKEFIRKKRYQDYPDKLAGMILKLKNEIRVPGFQTPLPKGTKVFCCGSAIRPNGVIVKVRATHEGSLACFEEEANNFITLIDCEEIEID